MTARVVAWLTEGTWRGCSTPPPTGSVTPPGGWSC